MYHSADDVKTSFEPDAPERTFAVTFGTSMKQPAGTWTDQRKLTWEELTEILTDHREGPKDGPCIVPATLRQPERKAEHAQEISVLSLDSDCGHSLAEIKATLSKHGYTAVIHSTHSHLQEFTVISKVERGKLNGDGSAEHYLIQKKGYLPKIAVGAKWGINLNSSDEEVIFHQPCPKFRIILLLDHPWRACDYENQDVAIKVWREQYKAAAHHLGLKVDPACSDPSRLFFLPRHDPGKPFETLAIEGKDFPIWSLPGIPDEETSEKDEEPPKQKSTRNNQGTTVIAAFNQKYPVEAILERNGYRKVGNKYLCPNSSSGMPGVSIKDGRAFSHHSSDPLFTGDEKHAHDAFSIFQVLEHGDDQTEAVRAAAAELGLDSTKSASSANTPSEPWEEPTDLTRPIPPAPAFPRECLPYRLLNWASDIADRMQTDLGMVVICMIITCAGLIGKDVYLRPKARDDWQERPCLWGMLIAPPASMKSQVLKEATAPLRRIQTKLDQEYARELKEWKPIKKENDLRQRAWKKLCESVLKKDPSAKLPPEPAAVEGLSDEPKSRRMLVHDSTMEKLIDLMVGSRGLTQIRDEIAGWALNMGRYNNGSDRQFFLEAYSGGSYSVSRISRGEQFVKDLYLNVLGGIQPGVAGKLFSQDPADNDGFFQRFGLMVYPEAPPVYKHVDRWPSTDKRKLFNDTCDKLAESDWEAILCVCEGEEKKEPPYVRFSKEAQKVFDDWLVAHMNALKNLDFDDPIAGHLGKARGLLVRLCLVLHLASWAGGETDDPKTVELFSLTRAATLLEEYLVPMWDSIFAAFG